MPGRGKRFVHHTLLVSVDERRRRRRVVRDQRIGDPQAEPFREPQLKRLHCGLLPIRIVDEPGVVE